MSQWTFRLNDFLSRSTLSCLAVKIRGFVLLLFSLYFLSEFCLCRACCVFSSISGQNGPFCTSLKSSNSNQNFENLKL